MLWSLNRLFCSLVFNSLSLYSSNLHLPLCVLACLSLFVSLGKSRQWDPWLQRPSCHSKSQSHLWHWASRSHYLWTFVHHLPGRERGETRECGRGKRTDRMRLFLHVCHLYAHTSTEKYLYIIKMSLCFAELSSSRIFHMKKHKKEVFMHTKESSLLVIKGFYCVLNLCVPHSSTLPGGSVPPCPMTRWDTSPSPDDDKWSQMG